MEKPKIAIIGAGLAGLTAAYRLFEMDFDVNLFEARNRVGGRLLSVLMKNPLGNISVLEMGGQNITDGGDAENLQALIDEFGIEVESGFVSLSSRVYHEGQYYNYNDLMRDFLNSEKNLEQNLTALAENSTSISELLDKLLVNYPALKTALYTLLSAYEGIEANKQSIHHNLDTLACLFQGGFAKAHEAYEHEPNHIFFKKIKGGSAQLALKISERLDDRVHLNKVLKKVLKSDEKIALTFEDATTEIFDVIILAIPASVYHDIEFDQSLIPQPILQAINKIEFGQNTKIYYPLNFSVDNKIPNVLTDKFISFINVDTNTLILYLNHPLQSVSDELQVVKEGYGIKVSISDTEFQYIADQHYAIYNHAIAHSWPQDPYSQGSYSGYSTNISTELDEMVTLLGVEFKKIFQPINNQLFFIGEHTTILEYIGTMEAAVESAERLVTYLSSKRDSDIGFLS